MKPSTLIALLAAVWLINAGVSANAAMDSADLEAAGKANPEFAAAVAAIEDERWLRAVHLLEQVVEARPWDDDAHTLLGFSQRRLGRYMQAFRHYRRALDLNPYHRGAMEYLGEAYLETRDKRGAQDMLQRLAAACRRDEGLACSQAPHCPEWHQLRAAIANGIGNPIARRW